VAVKILGGQARGLVLPSPGKNTRPTLVQLKRRLFDFKQDWSECLFVDLCSGTGSMGLEAWSRGAEQVLLIEKDKNLQSKMSLFLAQTAEKYPSMGHCEVLAMPIERWMKQLPEWYQSLSDDEKLSTVIYLDPPYEAHELYQLMIEVFQKFQANYQGRLLVESDELKGFASKKLEDALGPYQKIFTQGASFLVLWDFRPSE
jgi:16S rRNA (guanine966-N2)-methyltransferase